MPVEHGQQHLRIADLAGRNRGDGGEGNDRALARYGSGYRDLHQLGKLGGQHVAVQSGRPGDSIEIRGAWSALVRCDLHLLLSRLHGGVRVAPASESWRSADCERSSIGTFHGPARAIWTVQSKTPDIRSSVRAMNRQILGIRD